jgi:hypothetical protein
MDGMVGPFWVVEADAQPAVIALAVPLEKADAYGDMLTVDTGHLEYWSRLARRGASLSVRTGSFTGRRSFA